MVSTHRYTPRRASGFLVLAVGLSVFLGCDSDEKRVGDPLDTVPDETSSDTVDVLTDAADTGGWAEQAVEPSAGFVSRQQAYLQYCHDGSGPGGGGVYGQTCRVALGATTYNEVAIDAAIDKVTAREDTSDFSVAGLVRILQLDRETHALPDDLRSRIEQTVIDFKYWIDEPGEDKMCYWSENHQILYHSNELIAGQLFPDTVFPNAGMTGTDHVEHATPLAQRWLDLRGRLGFSEWHSNVYFNEDIPALLNLADFAQDEQIRRKAAMVLDVLAFDCLNNYYRGNFATVHGRTYPSKLLDGLKDSIREWVWVALGLGDYDSADNFSAAFLATSPNYAPPLVLEDLAATTAERHEHRQRDGFDVIDGPTWGISYTGLADIIVWAGMVALMVPEVIDGTAEVLTGYDLWNAFLFGDLPEYLRQVMQNNAGTPNLRQLAVDVAPLLSGIALESMSTYTFRTPHYQLSGGQDYNPGVWGAQTHMWQATLDQQAYVFTTYPSHLEGLGTGLQFAGDWIGSWLPRVALHQNIGVIQYRKTSVPMVDPLLVSTHTHAFFPKNRFDEIREGEHWTLGRSGDGYVALYSQTPTEWAETNDYELIAPAETNVWIVELGSVDDDGPFAEFADALEAATVQIGDTVVYDSPSQGLVEVGWEGPMTVDGNDVDLGPYPRWDNPYAHQEFGTMVTVIETDAARLTLDFENTVRTLETRRR